MSYEDIRHWNTPEDFNAYLLTLLPPSWFKIIITHHTYIPNENTWNGLITMKGMLKYYKGKGWDRFPHLFIAPDGIWQMNKITETGIHANAANPKSIGIEVVGNYDIGIWQDPIKTWAFKTHAYLAKWGKIPLMNIQPHRQYNPLKTCPGRRIDMGWVRNGVQRYLDKEPTMMQTYKVRATLPNGKPIDYINIREAPNQYAKIAARLYPGDTIQSSAIKDDERHEVLYGKSQWIHITKGTNLVSENVSNTGFAHISLFDLISS